jgi:hypothetical protein
MSFEIVMVRSGKDPPPEEYFCCPEGGGGEFASDKCIRRG